MPTTVNGIGTHYYGKKNRQTRTGVCTSCGAQGKLESYDTRLWFVIVFVPVIPLGRKRIIDQCPVCSRHYAAPHSAWEMSRQLSVSGAEERYRTQPSPETALEVHGNLVGFRQFDEASRFREEALRAYADSAILHAGLAMQLVEGGAFAEALALFERALGLWPDLPEARVGVAQARMADGKLDEARELLRFLEEPGAGQLYPLGILEALARAYQKAGRHKEALELFERLLAEFPDAGQVHEVRKMVAASERAVGRQTVLPPRSFSLRSLFDWHSGRHAPWVRWAVLGAVAVCLVLVGLAAMNEYRRQHRTMVAVNDCGKAFQVTIDDRDPIEVAAVTKLELAEGRHHVKVAGPVNEEFDVEMAAGYFERWTRSPVWVLNLGGGTALVDRTVYYAVNPRPSDVRLHVGENFYYFPHVDYAFEAPPRTMKVESKTAEVVKTHVDRVLEPPRLVFFAALAQGPPQAAFRFGEARLRGNPDDAELLNAYLYAAEATGQADRAREFLKTGLARRPVSVAWHRAYQESGKTAEREAAMAAEYDAMLKSEPQDARLLYLRGRVTDDVAASQDFFRRACRADPSLAWPLMALAYDAASRGDWKESRALSEKAHELKLDDPSLVRIRHLARLALGETAAMEAEYRQRLQADSTGDALMTVVYLAELLAVQGKVAEARQVLSDWESRLPPAERTEGAARPGRQALAYMIGDFAGLLAEAPGGSVDAPEFRLHGFLAAGRPQDAVKDAALQKQLEKQAGALAVSLAYSLAGNQAEAAAWRDRACAAMDRGDGDDRRAAAMLRGPQPPSAKQLDEFRDQPNMKALLVAALAARFPQRQNELAATARRLNVGRLPPYHLVRKAVEEGK